MAASAFRFPGLAKRAREKYRLLIEPMRSTARKCGYAIGVHGSLARDVDLIAVPWTREAVSGNELAERLITTVKRLLGREPKNAPWWKNRRPTEARLRGFVIGPTGPDRTQRKPHGRRCWVIHLGGGPYIDLSVMPRAR